MNEIEEKVINLFSHGMNAQDIAENINEIYFTNVSKSFIKSSIESMQKEVDEWSKRPLNACYPFVYVGCLNLNIVQRSVKKKFPLYMVLGIDVDGRKDILSLDIDKAQNIERWTNILSSLKERGVEDIFYVCIDDTPNLSEAVHSFYPQAQVQYCTVHFIRESTHHVSRQDMKEFCDDVKAIYNNCDVSTARTALDSLKSKWGERYSAAIAVWENNFAYIEQLYAMPEHMRKIIYTTNAIESLSTSLRKVMKDGAFAKPDLALLAAYIRITRVLYLKWSRSITNWKLILSELMANEQNRHVLAKQSPRLQEDAANYE